MKQCLFHAGLSEAVPAEVRHLPVAFNRGYERYVDKADVAELLGVSVSWVEKRATDRSFPSHKIDGRRKYRLSEIQAWVDARNQGEAA